MDKLYRRIEVFKRLEDNTWNTDGEVLTDAYGYSVVEGIGSIIDSFVFNIVNANNNLYKTYFSDFEDFLLFI